MLEIVLRTQFCKDQSMRGVSSGWNTWQSSLVFHLAIVPWFVPWNNQWCEWLLCPSEYLLGHGQWGPIRTQDTVSLDQSEHRDLRSSQEVDIWVWIEMKPDLLSPTATIWYHTRMIIITHIKYTQIQEIFFFRPFLGTARSDINIVNWEGTIITCYVPAIRLYILYSKWRE